MLSFVYKVGQGWFSHVDDESDGGLVLLSSQATVAQKCRDEAVNNLATTMSDMYAFLCEADQVKRFESQAKILIVMLQQTEECAYFIQGYAETSSFRMLSFHLKSNFYQRPAVSVTRTAKNVVPSADDKVTLYQDKFKHLKQAFLGYAILQTEIIVTRVLDVVKDSGKCFHS